MRSAYSCVQGEGGIGHGEGVGDGERTGLAAQGSPNTNLSVEEAVTGCADVVFNNGTGRKKPGSEEDCSSAELYEQPGRLKMGLEWLKKTPIEPVEDRKA